MITGERVLALFDLRAYFPSVAGPKQLALVVAQCRLGRRTNERQPTDLLRSPAVDAR